MLSVEEKRRRKRLQRAAYRERNPEKVRAKMRADYARRNSDPEVLRQYQKVQRLKHRYGITLEEWQYLFEAQGGRCAICFSTKPGDTDWHTDHNHATGKVRGILCRGCNHALGNVKESPEVLEQAVAYLRAHA